MDYKKTNAPTNCITRDVVEMADKTGNVYESVVICSKMADQVNADIRKELYKKLEEFSSFNDNLEEIHENREQIEVSKYYEKLPKPTNIAIEEFMNDNVYYTTQEINLKKAEAEEEPEPVVVAEVKEESAE
ncbi:MAG: DNA-directed RNA polymerase subunit omega [Bacteroidales bacterium]|jgi:DNA-directed RNA polymerase subunit K/omega|nr:DNA-directed RNA polymerase subunit omega [Bacteroidales bacterium]MBQ2573662.1 DNA-directed RNA polymerase subunit omega [Bacteroidales bacterium]MBQ3831771.1 DNA-directed RNA polymerase subunit omega [Bacteroidales bacterium]MBQ4474945.1 DNA-directed RNA polymerase subunit omega [Bacteroidales bacterium]